MRISLKYLYGTIILLTVLWLIAYGILQLSKSRSFQFFGGLTNRVHTQEKVIALSFDDAPTPNTPEVLDLLQQKEVKATFYVIGETLERNPDIGKAIAEQGHELGNHSYTHQRFLLKSLGFIDQEIQKTNSLIRNTGYEGEITFRPPYGKKLITLPWYLHQHAIKSIMCDVEADTYKNSSLNENEGTNFLVSYTVANTKPGSIILLHPFCDSCVSDRQAIPRIIDELKAQGYTFVTVSELLKYNLSS